MSSSLFSSFQGNTKCESSFFADTCTLCVPIFDVAMGSFDGAEVCELISLFALNTLTKKLVKKTSDCTVMMVWH
jgi:hypothetical protein